MRASAACALQNLARVNAREMWEHAGTRAALLVLVADTMVGGVRADDVRKSAIDTIFHLAHDDDTARKIWKHAGCRMALLEAVKSDVADNVRESAYDVLQMLAHEAANAREMWEHVGLRTALLEGAGFGTADSVRVNAVETLMNLARVGENAREMLDDEGGTRRVLLVAAAAEDGGLELRTSARGVLELLFPNEQTLKWVLASFEAGRRAASTTELIDVSGPGEPGVVRVEPPPARLRGTGKRGADDTVHASEFKRVKRETEGLTDALECIVCTDARRDTVLLPCSHLAVCGGCCALLPRGECPICRATVEDTVLFIPS